MTNESVLSGDYEARFIQPYQATKRYVCPSCNRDIEAGTGHYVVVPKEASDLRRHWHRGCWERHLNPRVKKRRGKNIGLLFILVAAAWTSFGRTEPAHACSCMTTLAPPEVSTFVGRVMSKSGDVFVFTELRETSPDITGAQISIGIMARRPTTKAPQLTTSCDLSFDQPLVGGVYRVALPRNASGMSSCSRGTVTLVEAPPPTVPATAGDEGRDGTSAWTWAVPIGVILAAGGGLALKRRPRRPSPARP